jgi:hypothetical protein
MTATRIKDLTTALDGSDRASEPVANLRECPAIPDPLDNDPHLRLHLRVW